MFFLCILCMLLTILLLLIYNNYCADITIQNNYFITDAVIIYSEFKLNDQPKNKNYLTDVSSFMQFTPLQ